MKRAIIMGVMIFLVGVPRLARATESSSGSGVELGVGGGLVVAPTFLGSNPVLLAALASFEIDLPLSEKLSLRVSPMLGGGVAPGGGSGGRAGPGGASFRLPGNRAVGFVGLFVDGAIHLHFTETVRGGIGWMIGLPSTLDFVFGPSLMPFAIRFSGGHELALWIGLPFFVRDGDFGIFSVLPTVRYAHFF